MTARPPTAEHADVIRAGLLDTSNALVPRTMSEKEHNGLLALDALLAELAAARGNRDALAAERDRLAADLDAARSALHRTRMIALYGPGDDTTPEQALATIAEFVARRLARAAAGGGGQGTPE